MTGDHTPSDESDSRGPALALIAVASTHPHLLNVVQAGPTVRLDVSHSIFQHYLRKKMARNFQALTRRWFQWTVPLFWASQAALLAAPFVPKGSVVHLCISVIGIVFAFPSLVLSTGSLSVDMVHALLAETEYRVATILNTLQCAVIASTYREDLRAVGAINHWCTVQLSFTVDADVRLHEHQMRSTIAAIIVCAAHLCYALAEVLDTAFDAIFTINGQSISVCDVLLWTCPTLLVLLIKNLYCHLARHQSTTTPAADSHARPGVVHYCSTYRVRLSLAATTGFGSRHRLDGPPQPTAPLGTPIVRSNAVHSFVDTTHILVKTSDNLCEEKLGAMLSTMLYGVGLLSFVASCCGSVISQVQTVRNVSQEEASPVPIAALVGTAIFLGLLVRYLHRHILGALCRSFDVVFSSLQFVCGSIAPGYMCKWDSRCVSLLTWALWFHALLIFDALTPPVRQYLRLNLLVITPIVLFTLYAFGGPVAVIYGYTDTQLEDVAVFKSVRLSTVLLARVLTLWLWNMRLVYEFGVRDENELILLKDTASYSVPTDIVASHISSSERKTSTHAIAPA